MAVNGKDEFGYRRTTRKHPPIPTPTATPLKGTQNLGDVERDGTNSKSSDIDSCRRKRPILAIRTVSPLVQQANNNTSPTPPISMRHNLDPVPKICSSFRDMQFGSDKSPDNSHRWKARTDDSFQHGPKERKRNQATFSSKVRDILEWRMMKPGTAIYLERQDDGDHGSAKKTKKVAGAMRDLWKSRNINNPKDKGPKAGQLYEIVNRHVIEDSIDKTVTLSTWRERVDGGHESDTDNMSIYYISPDGYAHEGAHAAEVNANFERRQLGSRHEFRRQNHGTSHGPVEADNDPSSTSTKGRENYNGYRHAQYNDTGSAASNKGKRTRSRAKEGGARSDSSPWASLTKFKAPNGPFIQQESTPIEKELPPPPFHPTRSGSTITSIRSASTTKFEKFLDGCRPSLVHVSDILKSLGIYKVAHLKAVARLSPETRDREVKEDALRLGMTVMEWAILVDKISQI